MSAKSLMVMGTGSDVGKSVIVTALCRAFTRAGVRVAPFKSQNMSNNVAVCPSGGEIGRAQAVQAEACGLEPTVDMNPVLLKPETETGCQVVIRGQARFHMRARDPMRYRAEAWPEIVTSYRTLSPVIPCCTNQFFPALTLAPLYPQPPYTLNHKTAFSS